MVTLFLRKFCTASSLAFFRKQLYHPQHPPVITTSIPFSQLQLQRWLIESHLNSTLDACTNLTQVKQVHAHIVRIGLHQCCYVVTKLLRTLTKLLIPMDPYPRSIFDWVQHPNPFLYTALIRGYCIQGLFSDSIRFYTLMRRKDIVPVSFTFTALFKACGAVMDVGLGRQMHAQTILIGGFWSDLYVGNTMIDMYVKCGFLECGHKVFDEMPERDVISWTVLLVAYAKNGDMDSASELFNGLPAKDMMAWTAMVTGFAQNAKPREAIKYFERMKDAGVETDEVTLVGVISACSQLGAAKYADWISHLAEKSRFGVAHNVVVGSALIDLFSKCGKLEDAFKVFEGMKERNVYSYGSMIMGFAMHGRAHDAMKLFDEMVKIETKPNPITFIGLLTACCHAGMVDQGWHIFESMEKSHGVERPADHYACMVDLLGRAGRLNEALKLIETMPIEPHGGVWGALLGAACVHVNPDIAKIAASHLFQLEPGGIGNYILLSNTYAWAGKWDDVSRVRKLMRTKGLKKNPGCSWVEAEKGVIHEFFAGDLSHPMSSLIKQTLEDLLDRLGNNGYEPNLKSVPYDLSNEEKRLILMTHSEKLALAFGLITTNPGYTIRIVKNLRICEDCHLVMCGASQITGREIVVRDNLRFHHFRDGTCSCGNFW